MSVKSKNAVQRLFVCGMLVAMEIVLNRYLSINTMGLKIGFSFFPPMLAAMLYGPIAGGVVYGIADFIGAILIPIGPYHPGFTLCAFCMGVMYGLFLRGERVFPRVLVPVLVNCLLLGLVVNTLWVSQLYGQKTYWGWFLYRLSEYAVLVPVQLILAPVVLRIKKLLMRIGHMGQTDKTMA